ncbi:hypothetical protein [Paraliobacillus zengyii]|uniref:hypothetical protein n=1 Tax=Paraliobacillus zengyii TaxID=2213194 RepID=UPI000DD47E61|nr:hypothetical protein [Paraliobacillus zengyii]
MIAYFKVDQEDLIAIYKEFADKFPNYKKNKIICGLFISILYLVLATSLVGVQFWRYIILFTLIMYFVGSKYVYKRALVKFVKKKVAKNKYLDGECKLTISEDKFIREYSDLITKTEWSSITMAKEDARRYFLLISGTPQLFVIKNYPVNFTDEEINEYNTRIHQYIKNTGLNLEKVSVE